MPVDVPETVPPDDLDAFAQDEQQAAADDEDQTAPLKKMST